MIIYLTDTIRVSADQHQHTYNVEHSSKNKTLNKATGKKVYRWEAKTYHHNLKAAIISVVKHQIRIAPIEFDIRKADELQNAIDEINRITHEIFSAVDLTE